MPTKYQAQVKMTPNVKPSQVRTEAAAMTASASNDTLVQRPATGRLRPVGPPSVAPQQHAALPLTARTRRRLYEACKRAFDLVAGCILLLIAIPIILTAATVIRLETKGHDNGAAQFVDRRPDGGAEGLGTNLRS